MFFTFDPTSTVIPMLRPVIVKTIFKKKITLLFWLFVMLEEKR